MALEKNVFGTSTILQAQANLLWESLLCNSELFEPDNVTNGKSVELLGAMGGVDGLLDKLKVNRRVMLCL